MIRYKEPKAMVEIHAIRENIYKETKNMNIDEKLEYIHRGSAGVIRYKKVKKVS